MPHYSGHNPHYDGTGTSGGAVGGYTPPKPPKPEPPKPGAGSGSNTGTSDEQIANAVNQLNTIVSNQDDKNKPGNVVINDKFIKPGGVFEPGEEDLNYSDMNEAQKTIYNFYASSTPNLYQQNIQDFISASPLNMEIYKNSGLKGAGLNAFMTTAPEAIIGNTMLGQLLRTIGGGIKNTSGAIRDKLSGILSTEQGQEADSNIQSAYQKYLDSINKEIVATRDQKPNIAEVSGESTPLGDIYGVDYIYDKDYMLPGAMEEAILAGQEPGDTEMTDDEEFRTLLNQYSLLGEEDLAGSLVDETQESELEKAIDPNKITDPKVGEDDDMYNMPPGYPGGPGNPPIVPFFGAEFPKTTLYATGATPDDIYGDRGTFVAGGDFSGDEMIPPGTVFSDNISTMPKLGDEIKSVDFSNLGYKDGGSVYNVLKLINDTMHDG
jgi:hypothetical protein